MSSYRASTDAASFNGHRSFNKLEVNSTAAKPKVIINFRYARDRVGLERVGYFVQSTPADVGPFKIAFQIFAKGKDSQTLASQSDMCVTITNREDVLDLIRTQRKIFGDIIFKIKVDLKPLPQHPIDINATQFLTQNIVEVRLPFSADAWQAKDSVNIECSLLHSMICTTDPRPTPIIDVQLKQFDLMMGTGPIHVYSSNTNDYEVRGDEIRVTLPQQRDANKEKHNKKEQNSNEDTKEDAKKDVAENTKEGAENPGTMEDTKMGDTDFDDELCDDGRGLYVRADFSVICALNPLFYRIITQHQTQSIAININIRQIEILLFFACTHRLHDEADALLMIHLGDYLLLPELKRLAIQKSIRELHASNVLRCARQFASFQISHKEGLKLLTKWIKQNRSDIANDLYETLVDECRYVDNSV